MISIRLWQLVAVSIVSGVFGGLISSAARVSSIGNVVAAEQADEARTAMDKAEEKAQDRYAATLEEAKERHAAMFEAAKKRVLSADVRKGKKRPIGWFRRLRAVSVAGDWGRQAWAIVCRRAGEPDC